MVSVSLHGRASQFARTRSLLASALTMLLALAGSGLLVSLAAAPAQAAVTDPFNKVFSANVAGGIQIRGNTVLSCQDAATSCAGGRSGSALNNNQFFMTNVDVDVDGSTFNSSTATVDVPDGGSVLFAALTWGGNTLASDSPVNPSYGSGTGAAAPNPAGNGLVELKVPGSGAYAPVTSTRTSAIPSIPGAYQGYADVTAAVRAAGDGDYTVANVQAGTGRDRFGGWALTIAYSDPAAPPRSLSIFSGFGSVVEGDDADIAVSGFQAPPSGTVRTTLGAVSFEGDANSVGDQMMLGSTVPTLQEVSDGLHPVGNTFDSTISDEGVDSSSRLPKFKNQLGFDAATFNVDGYLATGSKSAVIKMATGGESFYPGVVTFATDLFTPALTATKSVTIAAKAPGNVQSGVAEPGDTLEYTVNARNDGQDSSADSVLTDVVPTGTTYQPGSLASGGSSMTDATDGDIGSYDSGSTKVSVNIGTSATGAAGGKVAVGASIPAVTFRVTVDSTLANGALITNGALFDYAGDATGIEVSGSSNVVTTPFRGTHSALSITKSANLAVVQRGSATEVTYTLTVVNSGPYADPDVHVTDALPAGAVVVSAIPSSGTCTTPGGTVACELGALANGGTATVSVAVTLDGTTGPSATDTAGVDGANVDNRAGDDSSSITTDVNTAPIAVDDAETTVNGVIGISVLANDSDPESDPLSVSPGATLPTKGGYVVNPDKTITYTATPGAVGTDAFSYDLSDGRGGTASATVTITIPNTPPVAVDDATTTLPGQPATILVLGNDTDPNLPTPGQSLTVSALTQPTGGTGTVTTNGTSVTFTPSGTFRAGSATFTYTVSDGAGGTDEATVTVGVSNVGPVAADDVATTPYLTPVTADVLPNDTDDNGDPLTVTVVTGASHGTAVITGSGTGTEIRYTPAATWSGVDSMTYTITDGTTTATATLTVTTLNAPPTAADITTTVPGGEPAAIPVLDSADDPNGDPLTVSSAGPAAHGSTTVDVDGTVVYTPDPAYAGTDTFGYTVSDGQGGFATATVTVTVENQGPTAVDDEGMVPINGFVDITVLLNDTDPNNDPLAILDVADPGHGLAEVRPGGVIRYFPSTDYLGSDTFTYRITDANGGVSTATVIVTVANQPPVAVDDHAVAAGNAGSSVTIFVLANDTDPNGDPVTIEMFSGSAHGQVALEGNHVVYTPNANYAGLDTFTYEISDGRGGVSGATVTVDVQNRAPVAIPDVASVPTGVATDLDVIVNDTDPDNETLTLLSVDGTTAEGGTVTIVDGKARYVSATGFTGPDTFTYVVADQRGGTDTTTVTVQVSNAAPTAIDHAVTTPTDIPKLIDLLEGATDPDGQPLVAGAPSDPPHGSVAVDGSGIVTYTPDDGYAGPDSFIYTISDGQNGTSTATVTITVENAGPVAVDNERSVPYVTLVMLNALADDTDPNIPGTAQALTMTDLTRVSGGASVAWAPDGTVTVTPSLRFAGDVVIDYTVSDGAGGTDVGRIVVHVGVPAVLAAADKAATPAGEPVVIDVLDNDTSDDDTPVTLVVGSVTRPVDSDGITQGTVTLVDGRLSYDPAEGFSGTVTFRYTMRNGLGGTDTSTVTVVVANITPRAVDDGVVTPYDTTVSVDVLPNDSDANIPVTRQVLVVGSLRLVSGDATISLNADGTVRVNPAAGFAGDVVIEYELSDGAGGSDLARLTVHVSVPTPTAVDDSATTAYDTSVLVDVLANDDSGQVGSFPTLVADSMTEAVDADNAVQGTVTLDDGELRYAPPVSALVDAPKVKGAPEVEGYSGRVTFDYSMRNGLGGTDVATVTITVSPQAVVVVPVALDPASLPAVAAAPAVVVVRGSLAQTGADIGFGSLAALLLMTVGTVAVWLTRIGRAE